MTILLRSVVGSVLLLALMLPSYVHAQVTAAGGIPATQPVSGTVTVTDGAGALNVICDSGCGTTDTDDGSIAGSQSVFLNAALAKVWSGTAWVRLTQGQATMAASLPVALASDQSALAVTGTFWQATQPVSGTVTANQGGTWTVQPGNTANTTAWLVTGTGGTFPVTGTFWQATQPVSATNLDVQIGGSDSLTIGTFPDNEPFNVGQINGTATDDNAGSVGTGTQRIVAGTGTIGTTSTVASSATSVTLKAANTSRLSLIIYNDSTAILRVKYGATASATDFTWAIPAAGSLIIGDYNGVLDGIWASANGNARITEVTP